MKTLVLITSQFPFGTGETFIGAEFPLLSENFDKIILIAQNVSSGNKRPVSGKTTIYRYNTSTSIMGFLCLPVLLISNAATIVRLFRGETAFRKRISTRLSFKNRLTLLRKILKALQLKDYVKDVLGKEGVTGPVVFYSYWLKTGAHAIAMLDYMTGIKIARAHGSDVYEEKTASGYLPLLNFSASELDAVFFASKNGMEYFMKKTGPGNHNFFVSRLGVQKLYQEGKLQRRSDTFTIVSCSNMIPLKRIDIIIRALSLTASEKEIEWVHFGDGILKKSLGEMAADNLRGPKIKFRFMGHVANEEIVKYYSENRIDLFINTSSTEGIPVSIMEAQAYGIPVIATDTGGLREIISKESGSLLPVSLKPEDLAREIEHYLNLPEKASEILRVNAFNNWYTNFNATLNYRSFITEVNSILATRK